MTLGTGVALVPLVSLCLPSSYPPPGDGLPVDLLAAPHTEWQLSERG